MKNSKHGRLTQLEESHSKFEYDEMHVHPDKDTLSKGLLLTRIATIFGLLFTLVGFGWLCFILFYKYSALGLKYLLLSSFPDASLTVMGYGGVVFTLGVLATQAMIDRRANIQKDMPVILVSPRLAWDLPYLKDSQVRIKSLKIEIGLRNVGSAPAILLEVIVPRIEFTSDGDNWEQVVLEERRFLIDGIPGHTNERIVASSDAVCIDITNKCPTLFEALILNKEKVCLRVSLEVVFQSIRQLPFRASAEVLWSSRACRQVFDNAQLEFFEGNEERYRDTAIVDMNLSPLARNTKDHSLSGIVKVTKSSRGYSSLNVRSNIWGDLRNMFSDTQTTFVSRYHHRI
jgi:hypothetical protein